MAKSRTRKSPPLSTVDSPGGDNDLLAGGSRTPIERAAEQDEIEILNQLRDEAGNGGYVRLSRRIDGSMDYAQVAKILIADYSMDRVQQVYGGGYYRLRFCTEDHKICGQRQLIIDPSLPFKNPAAPAVAPAPTQAQQDLLPLVKELLASKAGPAGPSDSTMLGMFTLMMEQNKQANERFEKMLLAMNNNAKPPTIDPLTLKLLELQLSKERTPMAELLESFSAFKKITGGKTGDDDDEPLTIWDKAGKVLGPIAEGLAAKYLVGGEGGDEIVPRRAIAAGTETAAAAPAETNGALPAAAAPLAPVTQFPNPRPTNTPMNAMVQMKVNQLMAAAVAAAKKNADPVAFANELLDEVPPKFYENVEAMAKSENWFETLFAKTAPGGGVGYHPDALAAKEWLTKMRDALVAALAEALGPEEAAPGGH